VARNKEAIFKTIFPRDEVRKITRAIIYFVTLTIVCDTSFWYLRCKNNYYFFSSTIIVNKITLKIKQTFSDKYYCELGVFSKILVMGVIAMLWVL